SNEMLAESWSDPEISVTSETSIELTLPQGFSIGKPVWISGRLREEPGYPVVSEVFYPSTSGVQAGEVWNPVANEEVEILVEGESVGKVMTDSYGYFQVSHVFPEGRLYKISATFQGTTYHLASTGGLTVGVRAFSWYYLVIPGALGGAGFAYVLFRRRRLTRRRLCVIFVLALAPIGFAVGGLVGRHLYPWVYLAAVVPAAVSAWMALLMVRWLWRRVCAPTGRGSGTTEHTDREPETADADSVVSALESPPVEQREPAAQPGTLVIEFPQIGEGFPDVWGVGDDLHVRCTVPNGGGPKAVPEPLQVYLDIDLVRAAQVDEDRKVESAHSFGAKGQHLVSARIMDGKAERGIRIVDYRAEVIGLFNSLLQHLRSRGIDIPSEATPREIQRRVLAGNNDVDEAHLEKVVRCFEEADYSLHTIGRCQYEAMYLSRRAVLGE
ncbi:MAG: DUF4129 domain-containing protein, partial [Chloroflexi bacterium]|nr:DUF4129 domain-containing protein [Chloroflexota bacterium]